MLKRKYRLIYEGIVFLFSMTWMILNFATHHKYDSYIVSIIMFVLSSILVFYVELDYFKIYKQIKTFNFSMEFLIAIATHITYFFSIIFSIYKLVTFSIYSLGMEFWEVGFSLSFFIGIGSYLENTLKNKTSLGIKELLKLQQKDAFVLNKTTNEYSHINSSQILKDFIIKIPKGASIPTDGILISKLVEVDCSSLLGESIPRILKKGDTLLSGMINLSDDLIYKSTKKMSESMLNQIILQLENILKNKSNIERISEKIVRWFLPSILFISLLTFCIWLGLSYNHIELKFNISILDNIDYSNPFMVAIYHSVATLVIACPCAFGIAAPAAIYSSSGLAAKHKILFASAKVYESINKIKYIAFDKTGTLTSNSIKVTDQIGSQLYNNIIFSLSSSSTHPLSHAISSYLNLKDLKLLDSITEQPGVGIFTNYKNNEYFLGSLSYCRNNKYNLFYDFDQYKDNLIVVFAKNKKVENFFILSDEIKKDSSKTIQKLKQLKINPMILSGDRKEVVEKIAKDLNIDEFYYELLPIDKEKIIKKHQNIIFVGDGINDILAIKAASVGIAFSSGSDITNSVADISILDSELYSVYKTIVLSQRTIKLIKLNFLWAAIFNLICIPLAIIGIIPAWLGVILMTLSTIILLLNTLIMKSKNEKFLNQK